MKASFRQSSLVFLGLLGLLLLGGPVCLIKAENPTVTYLAICPDDYFLLDDFCYLPVVNNLLNWHDARRYCHDHGAEDLAHPPNVEQLQQVLLRRFGNSVRFWMGASDLEEEGVWRWVSGDLVPRGVWQPGQPNNCCGGEDCAVMATHWARPLNDNRCSNLRNYVCQVRALYPEDVETSDERQEGGGGFYMPLNYVLSNRQHL